MSFFRLIVFVDILLITDGGLVEKFKKPSLWDGGQLTGSEVGSANFLTRIYGKVTLILQAKAGC